MSEKVKEYKKKIQQRIDSIQHMMEENKHIESSEIRQSLMTEVSTILLAITMIDSEDIEYLQCVQHALEEEIPWNIPDSH